MESVMRASTLSETRGF